MRNCSVAFKLFVVTSLLVLFVFLVVMVAEGLFFERYYRLTKIHKLEQSIGQFADRYTTEQPNGKELARLLGVFMNEQDASFSILNGRLERLNLNPYFLEMHTDNGQIMTIVIPRGGMTRESIPQGLQAGDRLTIDGIFMDEQDTVMQPYTILPEGASPETGLVRVSGTIAEFLLPEQRSYNPYYQDALIDDVLREWSGMNESYLSGLRPKGKLKTEWVDKWSGIRYVILVHSLPGSQGERYVMVMTSLQPVGEAVGILKQYSAFVAPIIILLVLLLSLVYSRMVSRPLIQLSRSAKRLARLDFSGQPDIRSKDEFGELSRDMIAMSTNLDAALKELTAANAKLYKDMQEKERTEQLRKELIANISHELKTPLSNVKGFAEGLQDGIAEEKRERYLALIASEADRMNTLIGDMLELSKFELKAVRLNVRSCSLRDIIKDALDSFSHQMESKGLTYKLNLEGQGEQLVQADTAKLEQVVLNLLSNAVRHATANSVIDIMVERRLDGRLRITIENAGLPIAEEDLDRIWEHFYRVERSRDRRSGGTGLGLAIVKHILELHGSEYGVRNTSRGVAFYFTLLESRGNNHE
ncbi:HAMP domain-containing protein [Paenibacillus sp. 1011MAR3C5]|uniref:sensor histidine kinase n=1 Tax=Paenibacillus sp. 1011MAR3C5 TaxID=1675787 RepID=UPI000E6D0E61|nr:HAMP domain-containing sensor histidine kinase [Paenibacillus sp. 1011MAR3C5]RJE87475.1 HAMP domain-containing protein [Paenibacillus sp. 1011MAR3C5]